MSAKSNKMRSQNANQKFVGRKASRLGTRHTLILIGGRSERKRVFVDCRYTTDPWQYVRAGNGSLVDEIKAVPGLAGFQNPSSS